MANWNNRTKLLELFYMFRERVDKLIDQGNNLMFYYADLYWLARKRLEVLAYDMV